MCNSPTVRLALLAQLALLVPSRAATADDRPLHLNLQGGVYAALGSPASWGPSLAVEVLPGSAAGRWGLRGEYRGYKGVSEGSVLLGALFEAGASRPQLVLKLVPFIGITDARAPIVGGGIDWSLWILGPLGFSSFTDVQILIDGSSTRPALTTVLSLHLGH